MGRHLTRLLSISATMLLASGAFAQSQNPSPQAKGHGAEPPKAAEAHAPAAAVKAAHKETGDDKKPGDEKRTDEKAKSADGKSDVKGKSVEARMARKSTEHDAQRAKLTAVLKSPMDEATKQELRRHAERLARLERINALALEAKDTDAIDRAAKLTAKENARHDKWMTKLSASPAGGAAVLPGTPAQPEKKGAAQ